MCDEENRRADADALTGAGLTVHSCSPRSVADVGPALTALADAVGAPGEPRVSLDERPVPPLGLRVFVPIWRRPWMSLAAETYGSSVLDAIGLTNVFADAPDRYAEVTLSEAQQRRADLVLAPSEPYPFGPRHEQVLTSVAPVVFVDGQDLFWWGARTPEAVGRLHAAIAQHR